MWTLNKNGVTPGTTLNDVEQGHLNDFMNLVRAGKDPATAAAGWDSSYKKLGGTVNQYEIRLSKKNRATFTVNDATKVVTMLAVGGHT